MRVDPQVVASLNDQFANGMLHPRQPGKDFFLVYEPISYHIRQALDAHLQADEYYIFQRWGSLSAMQYLMSMRANEGMAERIAETASEEAAASRDTWENTDGQAVE
jgi:hypothetical protein